MGIAGQDLREYRIPDKAGPQQARTSASQSLSPPQGHKTGKKVSHPQKPLLIQKIGL